MKKFFSQFGGKVTNSLVQRYQTSKNWKDGSFQNIEETTFSVGFTEIPRVLIRQLSSQSNKEPSQDLPIHAFDEKAFLTPSKKAKFIWYGHSVVLMRLLGKTLLIDPMLGNNTTPIAPIPTSRFSKNALSLIDDFPAIDLVLLTHDHYDHLDYDSIQKLKPKVKQYFVALGVKRHLVQWGVDADTIIEFDWWDKKSFAGIDITFTPTRHFSGRGLADRSKCLWGGWVFKTSNENIWFSGDGGYGTHFKEVGRRCGEFDFAFMECGQYNEDWEEIHLFPQQSIDAALDALVKKAMPVHWGGFALSYYHNWFEPVEKFVQFANQKDLPFSTPSLGKLFQVSDEVIENWWDEFK